MSKSRIKLEVLRLPHAADLPLPAYQSAGAAGLDLRIAVAVRVDHVLDRPVNGSRVLIHAVLDMKDPFVHMVLVRSPRL